MSKYMKLNKIISYGISLALIFTCISCGHTTSVETVPLNDEDDSTLEAVYSGDDIHTIGISMPAKHLERWPKDGAFLEKMFEAEGYEVLISYGDNLIDTQINDINRMIADGAQLLIIAPVDSSSLDQCLKNANKKNIPVVAYDRLIKDSKNLIAYISYDNYLIGKMQGQYIVDSLNLNDSSKDSVFNLEIFAGDPADNNSQYYYNGAMEVLNPYIESGKLQIYSGQKSFFGCCITSWDSTSAQERMEILLSSYYSGDIDLNAVLCPNDSIAIGICDALKESYKKSNNVIVTGQDCDEQNVQNIKNGIQSMSIYKPFDNEALATFYIVDSYLNGVSLNDDLSAGNDFDFSIKRDITSYKTADEPIISYLLTPEVVTIENIDDFIND